MRPAEIILLVFALFLLVRGLIGVVRQQIRVGGYARIPPLQGPAALIVSLLGMAFGSMVAVDVLVGPG
ncbi:MAG: hypothetical protein ACFB51_05910 [Anaerolineae bacterium]